MSVLSARWSFHQGRLAEWQPASGGVWLLQHMGSGFCCGSCSSGSCSSSLQIGKSEEFVYDFSSDTKLCKHACCHLQLTIFTVWNIIGLYKAMDWFGYPVQHTRACWLNILLIYGDCAGVFKRCFRIAGVYNDTTVQFSISKNYFCFV